LNPNLVRAALATLILAITLLVASTWGAYGATWDEPEHLAAGMELLDHGGYEYDLQHPPLGRLMIALGPWLAGAHWHGKPPPDGRAEGLAILHDAMPGYDRTLTLARLGVLPFLPLLLLATFLLARRVMEPAGALLAAGFAASTPVLLGQAGLAALDVPCAATVLLALLALLRWFDAPGAARAAWFGVAAGIAVCTKMSAIPFLAVCMAVLAVAALARGGPAPARPWRDGALALLLVAVTITLAYGGSFSDWTNGEHRYSQALNYLFGTRGRLHELAYDIAAVVPLPDGFRLMIGGIQALQVHNSNGHLSYLLGEVRTGGWWYFYPVTLAAKAPLPLLALGLAGLLALAREAWQRRDALRAAPTLCFVAILAFSCVFSRINIGVRHVLVLLPLLAIGAAFASTGLWQRVKARAPRHAALAAGLALLFAWQLSSLPRAYPDYLAWFNEAIADPERIAVDSDLDWGQDLRRLERRLAQLQVPHVAIAYSGSADLAREPLPPFTRLRPHERATGWIALSALARVEAPGGYDWLYAYRPVERVGETIDLYLIPGGGGE
jgi:hypothetical protein